MAPRHRCQPRARDADERSRPWRRGKLLLLCPAHNRTTRRSSASWREGKGKGALANGGGGGGRDGSVVPSRVGVGVSEGTAGCSKSKKALSKSTIGGQGPVATAVAAATAETTPAVRVAARGRRKTESAIFTASWRHSWSSRTKAPSRRS